MNYFFAALKKYAVFSGRARRKEYWCFILLYLITYAVLAYIDYQMGNFDAGMGFGVLSGIAVLIFFLPNLAVTVRRLHDTDRSGWWILIAFVPLVGGIILIVFMLLDSNPMSNEYGPNPKEGEIEASF